MEEPTAVDLFAGAGGATQGLTQAGFRVVAAVENDDSAVASYRANHKSVHVQRRDIRSVRLGRLRERLGLAKGDLTLLKSCPPCQGFSSLGRTDHDDPRNDLVKQTWRFVRSFEPDAVLMENVPGLRHDERFSALIDASVRSGYGVRSYLVDASQFGVPQHRRRLILIAVKGLASEDMPVELVDVLPDSFVTDPPTAGEAIAAAGPLDGRDPVHRARTPKKSTLERIMAVPVGGSRFDLPADQQLACHTSLDTRSATSSYGRIKADKLAPTITTRCTTPACGSFVHPTEHRGLSLREAALLQTFPVGYRFEGGHGPVERQIGNAVPVRMAEALGLAVLALLHRKRSATPWRA